MVIEEFGRLILVFDGVSLSTQLILGILVLAFILKGKYGK